MKELMSVYATILHKHGLVFKLRPLDFVCSLLPCMHVTVWYVDYAEEQPLK